MAEPFKKAKEDVAVLTKELEAYDGEKALLRQAKARLLVAENRLNSLKWEDEVLRQKHLEVVQQRDDRDGARGGGGCIHCWVLVRGVWPPRGGLFKKKSHRNFGAKITL